MTKLRPDFLIVGMERSGTLWTSATLNEHPDIASFPNLPFKISIDEVRAGEVHFFNTLASLEPNQEGKFTRPLSDYLTKYNRVFADLVPLADQVSKSEFYQMMVQRYSDYCDRQRGHKKIVGESTPAYVFHLDFIDSFYPGIKKICSIREPKDKITSWHFSLLNKGRKTDQAITPEFAIDYTKTRIIPEYQALLDYHGVVYCITYENMFNRPQPTIRGLLNYLEIKATNRLIEEMAQRASFSEMTQRHTKQVGRKAGEEDRRESLRKGVAGDWRNHIAEDLARMIDDLVLPIRREVLYKYKLE